MRTKSKALLLVLATVLALGVPSAFGQNNSQVQSEIQKSLSGSKYKNVQVSVQDNVVTLSGTVDLLDSKEQADRKAHHAAGKMAIRNEIQVMGPEVSDAELQKKLVSAITYSRVGYPSQSSLAIRDVTPFNAISVSVQNGVVTLGGHAADPVSADDAIAIVSHTPGVKDVIDDIQVDPLSPMDDRIRIAVFRSIYGFPSLNKYAIDPAKPIRISVQNGNVTLYGEVDSKADRDAAGIRANTVPGVFHVTNDLQVAGAQPERK